MVIFFTYSYSVGDKDLKLDCMDCNSVQEFNRLTDLYRVAYSYRMVPESCIKRLKTSATDIRNYKLDHCDQGIPLSKLKTKC